MKVPRGMSKFIRDRYVWYIAILLGIIVIYTFLVEQVLFGKILKASDWHPVYMTIRNFMFLGVVFLSAGRFGFKGGLAVGLAIGLIELPHVVTEMFAGERRIDNLIEYAIFAPVGVLIAWLVGTNRRVAESLTLQANLLGAVPDGVFLHDFDGTFSHVNVTACAMFGYTRGELLNTNLRQLAMPETLSQIAPRMREVLENGSALFEVVNLRKDGSEIPLEIHATTVDVGGKKMIISMVHDISGRKQAEKALIHAAEEWKTTFDFITDMISIMNKDFTIVRANKAFADAFKMPLKEIIGKHCYEIMHAGGKRPSWCVFTRMLETGNPEVAEAYETRLGIHLEVSASPVLRNDGEITGCVHTVRDITERNKLKEQLMAQDRLASIGLLVSGIAHEINNPLTSVIGFSDLLLQRDLPDDVKDDLKIVHDEAKRTGGIVRDLLTFVRKQPEGKMPVDVNEVILVVLNLRSHEQQVNNIQVNTHFAPNLPPIMGNASQLQQVFFNIVINAEQVMLEAHNRGTLTITTEGAGDIVMARFADDGPGISPENMRKLFTPFFTTKDAGKGTGLGLSICHGIVTEHGGRIYAESEPGKGATFIVELPVRKEPTTAEESAG